MSTYFFYGLGSFPYKSLGMREKNEELIKKIGVNLKNLRTSKGLSLMDAAANAGIDKNSYYRIEKGEINTTVSMLEQVLQGMGENISDFFCQMK